jgi:hypothetical protein
MIKTQWKIKIGDMIHVRTHYKYGVVDNVHIKSGKVIASERQDPVGTFRLYTGNPQYPISLIADERVTGIKLRKVA